MYIKYLRTRREANGRPMKELRAVFLCCFFYFNFFISLKTLEIPSYPISSIAEKATNLGHGPRDPHARTLVPH
jgi:hypothetical protein